MSENKKNTIQINETKIETREKLKRKITNQKGEKNQQIKKLKQGKK